jgi:TRAP-type C4-dicarboxylate transport system substrate-binding protein
VEKWADLVEERTHKQGTFERFPAGQLYSDAASEYRALSGGLVNASGFMGNLLSGVKPGLDWPSIPGTVTYDNWMKVNKAVFPTLAKYLAQDNIKLLGPSYPGSILDVVFSRKNQFKSYDDFGGQKIHAHSKWQLLVAEIYGAGSMAMPLGEVYSALQRGQLDRVWSAAAGGPQAYKWNEVAPYVSIGVQGGIAGYYIVMSMKTWEKIPAGIQAIMTKAAEDAAIWAVNYNRDNYDIQMTALKGAVKDVYQVPKADADAMAKRALEIIWPEFTKQGPVMVKIKDLVEKSSRKR